MKRSTIINVSLLALTAIFVLWIAGKSITPRKYPMPPPAYEPQVRVEVPKIEPVTPKPKPVAIAPKIEPEAPIRYHTAARVTEMTDAGVRAIAKGVSVEVLGREDGKVIITDGKITLTAAEGMITGDKEVVSRLLADRNAQEEASQLQASIAATAAAELASMPVPELPAQAPVVVAGAPVAPAGTNPMHAIIDTKIAGIESQITYLRKKEMMAMKLGRVSGHGATINRLQTDINILLIQKSKLTP